jgi:hypothetical protein
MSRGFVATVVAAQRRAERDQARNYREQLKYRQQMEKLQQQANAAEAVRWHETYLGFIVSLHRDVGPYWEWIAVANAPPPAPTRFRENAAADSLRSFKPTLLDKMLGNVAEKRRPYEVAVANAQQEDQAETQQHYAEWEWLRKLAAAVAAGDLNAYRAALERFAPFGELEEVGAHVRIDVREPWLLRARVHVRNEDVIPHEEPKLLASGKISVKEMQKAKYWAYYQDYVCSAAIRTAREMFHLLPVRKVYVDVVRTALDTSTGHNHESVILSVEFERAATLALNFDRLDASDAIENMRHAMSFKKTAGFSSIETLEELNSITSSA